MLNTYTTRKKYFNYVIKKYELVIVMDTAINFTNKYLRYEGI